MMSKSNQPTVADLVVLAVLAEAPLHGYGLNAELERRAVEDWASVSRPQVYYSLNKLRAEGWIELVGAESGGGPDRRPFRVTSAGRLVLEEGLERPHWALGQTRSKFSTWLALAHHATPEARRTVIEAREQHLHETLAEEGEHLRITEVYESPMAPLGVLLIRHKIALAELELAWLAEVRLHLLG